MTPFWLWMSAGCALSALCGFSLVRFGVPGLRAVAVAAPRLERRPALEPQAPAVVASAPSVLERESLSPRAAAGSATLPPRAAPVRRTPAAVTRPAPAPTGARPEAEKLALWARQVRDGQRTFSLATDGCRVTWDRRCKHGHPSWLVHLGLLKPRAAPARHRPR